jgi:nitroreductase
LPEPDQLYEVMCCAPSTREFTDDGVSHEVIARVLDKARFAPSGGNRQPWRVIVVRDPDTRRRLRELYAEPWRAYTEETGARALLEGRASGVPPGRLEMLRRADAYAHNFDSAPVHLVICAVIDSLSIVDRSLDRPSIVAGASIYPFVQNVLLGLRAEGLGASFTTLLTPAEPDVRELLGIPDGIALAGHISVGVRVRPWPQRLSRNAVSEFAFGERWGESW